MQETENPTARAIYHALLFGAGERDEDSERIETTILPHRLDEARTDKGREEILAICREYNRRTDTEVIDKLYVQLSLYFCGEHNEAKEQWQSMLPPREKLLWNEEYPLRLFLGEWDPDRVLDKAKESGQQTAAAHYFIAHKYLYIDKNRAKAMEHFQACLDTGLVGPDFLHWARAYVQRLKDPEWLSWALESPQNSSP